MIHQPPGPHYGRIPPPPPYPPGGFVPPPPRRRRGLRVALAVVVAVLVLALAIVVPLVLTRDGADESGRAGEPETSNLDAVQSFDDLSTTHLEVGEDFSYPQAPPVGGRHAPVWLECGVYDEPVPEVNAVHDLEHGATWITYRADEIGAAGVATLAEVLPDNGILSPYPAQEAPVVITVWGRQLALTGPDDARIELFIAEYGAGETAPEPAASCHGGIDPADLPDGGVSA